VKERSWCGTERHVRHARGRGPTAPTGTPMPAVVERAIYMVQRKLELAVPTESPSWSVSWPGRLEDVRPGDQVTLAWRVDDSVCCPMNDVEAASRVPEHPHFDGLDECAHRPTSSTGDVSLWYRGSAAEAAATAARARYTTCA